MNFCLTSLKEESRFVRMKLVKHSKTKFCKEKYNTFAQLRKRRFIFGNLQQKKGPAPIFHRDGKENNWTNR